MKIGLRIINIIKDDDMRNAFKQFAINLNNTDSKMNNSQIYMLVHFITDIKLKGLSWQVAVNILDIVLKTNTNSGVRYLFNFIYYLIDHDLYFGDYKEEYIANRHDFSYFVNGGFNNKKELLQKTDVNPTSFIIFIGDTGCSYRVVCIQKPNPKLVTLIRQYLIDTSDTMNQRKKKSRDVFMLNILIESLEDKYVIKSIDDFCDGVFFQNFDYMKNCLDDRSLNVLTQFYIYIIRKMDTEVRMKNFKLIDNSILKYSDITKYLKDGYRIVNYNIYEEPPKYNRMILKENNMDINTTHSKDSFVIFENDFINNKVLSEYYTQFFWKDNNISFFNKRKSYAQIRVFLKQLDTKYEINDTDIQITVKDVMRYKESIMSDNISDSTIGKKLGNVKSFISYLDNNGILEIEAMSYRMFTHKEDINNDDIKEAYSNEEIHQLLEAFEDNFNNEQNNSLKLLYQEYYYALAIFTISEIRISSIFSIKTNSIQPTLTKKGKNEYKLVVNSKSVNGQPDEYNITHYEKNYSMKYCILHRKLEKVLITLKKTIHLFIKEKIGNQFLV